MTGSGDAGSFILPVDVDEVRAAPFVTVVGGTSLQLNGIGGWYLSESVWNESNEAPGPFTFGASGGGFVSLATPSYQQPVNTNSMRTIPDLSMVAAGTIWDVGIEVIFTALNPTRPGIISSSHRGTMFRRRCSPRTSLSSTSSGKLFRRPRRLRESDSVRNRGDPSIYSTTFNDIRDG